MGASLERWGLHKGDEKSPLAYHDVILENVGVPSAVILTASDATTSTLKAMAGKQGFPPVIS